MIKYYFNLPPILYCNLLILPLSFAQGFFSRTLRIFDYILLIALYYIDNIADKIKTKIVS